MDPAPSADRADGKDEPTDRLGVEAGPRPAPPGGDAPSAPGAPTEDDAPSPPGPPTEAYTSEHPAVEQDDPSDSG
jgi:hypothetical protein